MNSLIFKAAEYSLREFLKYAAGTAAIVVVSRVAEEIGDRIVLLASPESQEQQMPDGTSIGNPINIVVNVQSNNTEDASQNTDSSRHSNVDVTQDLEEYDE